MVSLNFERVDTVPEFEVSQTSAQMRMYGSCFLWVAVSLTFPYIVNQTVNMACSVPSIRCEKKAAVNSRCSQLIQTKLHLLTSTTWLPKRMFARCAPVSALLDRCVAVDYVCTAFLLITDIGLDRIVIE